MSQTKSRRKGEDFSNEWNHAIAEAKDMMERSGEAKARRLKAHIAMMEESRDAGESWGDQTTLADVAA